MENNNNNECGICFETYNEKENKPLVLPCSHSFCQECLLKLEESNTKTCSICRTTWNDTKMKDLLCCIQLIPSSSGSTTKKDVARCSEHDAEANSWCTTCDEVVCVRCLRLTKHKSCKWMLLEEKEYDAAVKKLADIVSKNEGTFKEIDRLLEQLLLDRKAVTTWQEKAKSLLAECPRVDSESVIDLPSSKLLEKTQALAELRTNEPAKEYAKLVAFIPNKRQSISSWCRPTSIITTKQEGIQFRPLLPGMGSREPMQNAPSSARSPSPERLSTARQPDPQRMPSSPFRPSRNSKIYQPTPFLLPSLSNAVAQRSSKHRVTCNHLNSSTTQ